MRGLIVGLVLVTGTAQAPVSPEQNKPPTTEQQLAVAQEGIRQRDAALVQCRTKVGEQTLIIDNVQKQIEAGQMGATKQIQNATLAALLKRIAEKSPGFTLDVVTGEIKPKK